MSSTAPCWVTRRESDPRFDDGTDTFAPPPGTWAPDCGHVACVEDDRNCPNVDGFHDYDCPVATCRWNTARGMCDLPKDHDGEHVFVSENEIILVFSDTPPAEQPTTGVGG